MKIVRSFGPYDPPEEGLWSLVEEEGAMSELDKVFEQWRDPERMYACCEYHLDDLRDAFGYDISARAAADELMEEAEDLEDLLYSLATQQLPGETLQTLFRPLKNSDTQLTELQLSKASAKTRRRKNPKLRLYAVRVDANTYLATGGAIKLTHLMEERPHTMRQFERMTGVRDWLKDQGILFSEDLSKLT
jgi:hypothetical protein